MESSLVENYVDDNISTDNVISNNWNKFFYQGKLIDNFNVKIQS